MEKLILNKKKQPVSHSHELFKKAKNIASEVIKLIIYYISTVISCSALLTLKIFDNTKLKNINFFISKQVTDIFGGAKNYINIKHNYDPLVKSQVNRIHFAIPSFGCSYYFDNGGCSMCGFNNEIKKYRLRLLSPITITFLVKCFMLQLEYQLLITKKEYDILTIYMAGSFINEQELPLKAQEIVIDFFTKHPFRRLCIESRPEYIKKYKNNLRNFKEKIKNKLIEVAIGYESNDNTIRNIYLKKNVSQKSYTETLKILESINIISSTYILVGSPFIKEADLKKIVIDSIKFAWSQGSVIVNIEIGCIQENTPWEELYHKKHLKLPTLWTIRDILLDINEISDYWYLGELSDWPKPIKTPNSCKKCEKGLLEQFDRIRSNHNLDQLKALEICQCHK